jgi:RNA polymerase sigma-70 factor (ECF subfamily)
MLPDREVGLAPIGDPEALDSDLAAAARAGDARAFETLLARHEGRVLRVLRLLGVPRQDREDVAQEVFLRVFRGLEGFRSSLPFASWVYRITVNAAHDHRARRFRTARQESGWSEEAGERALHDGPGPEAQALARERGRVLEQALGELSERERAVFVLREMEEIDTVEVARLLGVTTITVRRHLGLARRRLATILAGPQKKTGLP